MFTKVRIIFIDCPKHNHSSANAFISLAGFGYDMRNEHWKAHMVHNECFWKRWNSRCFCFRFNSNKRNSTKELFTSSRSWYRTVQLLFQTLRQFLSKAKFSAHFAKKRKKEDSHRFFVILSVLLCHDVADNQKYIASIRSFIHLFLNLQRRLWGCIS